VNFIDREQEMEGLARLWEDKTRVPESSPQPTHPIHLACFPQAGHFTFSLMVVLLAAASCAGRTECRKSVRVALLRPAGRSRRSRLL